MKKLSFTRAIILSSISLMGMFFAENASAQLIVGAAPASLNTNAMLQVQSANKGILFPRVALTNTTNASPLTAHVAGMVVYNTATANDVVPGLYQNNGVKWARLVGEGGATPGSVNTINLEVGQTYNYITQMAPTVGLDLDGSVNPTTGSTNYAPIIDSVMITFENVGSGSQGLYRPYLKNTSSSIVKLKYAASGYNNNFDHASNILAANGGFFNMDGDNQVWGGNSNSEILRAVIMINGKWFEFRITCYGGIDDTQNANMTIRNVSLSITRLG